VSRFASITVNQYGRGFPTGGMNEAGLAIALMALGATQYPQVDERPSAGILGWIQYQLDNSADIDEVLQHSAAVRITGTMGLHYLVSDRSGRTVTIEYLGGALVAHHDATLPVSVLANDTYDQSLNYLRTITGFGGSHPVPNGEGSLERFARAASMIRLTSPKADPVARAFDILEGVHQVGYTKWNVVYDPGAGTVYFRTDRSREIRSVSFASFDTSCSTPVRIIDINGLGAGDVSAQTVDYTTAANIALVDQAYAETPFLAGAPAEDRSETALYPEKDVCQPPRRSRRVRP